MNIAETAKTVALHPLDCRMYASEQLWNDASYALGQSTKGWIYIPDYDKYTRRLLAKRFDGLPQWPGEYMEITS